MSTQRIKNLSRVVRLALLGAALATMAACGGGGGFSIDPGSEEAMQAMEEIREVLAGLDAGFAAENPDAILALCSDDIVLGGNFMLEATGHARPSASGPDAVRTALSAYFDEAPASEYTFALNREPVWDGASAVGALTINVKDPSGVSHAASFASHTWNDEAAFIHTEGGWQLERLCRKSPYHNEGTGTSG